MREDEQIPRTALDVDGAPDGMRRLAAALADRYTIVRELGQGGMATVYLARDLKHDRDVAIKVLRDDLTASLSAERFVREIQLAARLSHPHILPLFDSGAANGALFYVMPVVTGESLRDRLVRERRLPVADAVLIAAQVAAALEHAHRQGIVHRDIKPENILLQDGLAIVADFGIGKAASAAGRDTLTQAGMSVGTPAYMSPEQAVGEPVDGRSDLYALGCVLYEMLAGEPPFTGPNAQAIIAKRFVQVPADITALRDGVSRPVARALQRALARTPVDRPATAADWMAELRATDTTPTPTGAGHAVPAQSIAVLPFTNLSPDKDNEFFGDGIAEDIINALSKVEGLHVAAQMSAFTFKGKVPELRSVGEQLKVATVLQGSVRKAGNRIRITAQLMAVADGYQLWTERYDRDLVDVFAVQDEIADAIASRLQLTFARPQATTPRATTAEVESYELIVRGRALTQQRGRAILEARRCFERALELMPDSVDAHAGLGAVLRNAWQYGFGARDVDLPLAESHLRRALALEPAHAFAMGHLAAVRLNYGAAHSESFRLWEEALRLDPRLSEIRALYGVWGLGIVRRGTEDAKAELEMRRAMADDPLNTIVATIVGIGLSLFGKHGEAAAVLRAAQQTDPASFGPHYALAWVHTWAREPEAALAAIEAGMERFGRHQWLLQALTGAYALQGDRRRAEAVHAEIEARAVTSTITYFTRAISALSLGRIEEAVAFAVLSAKEGDALGPLWYRWPGIEPIIAHPRYPEILAYLEPRG